MISGSYRRLDLRLLYNRQSGGRRRQGHGSGDGVDGGGRHRRERLEKTSRFSWTCFTYSEEKNFGLKTSTKISMRSKFDSVTCLNNSFPQISSL